MGVSNPRDDRAERNLGVALVPLSTVIPRAGNAHLQQNPISDSYILVTHTNFQHLVWVVGGNTINLAYNLLGRGMQHRFKTYILLLLFYCPGGFYLFAS